MPDIRYLGKMIGEVPVITAPAETDITSADQLRAVLLATAARGHATVVVDLTLTRFCDCCGLHTLLRVHKLAQADGGELRLVIPADGLVPRILALTCLDRLIPCFASLKEALAQAPAGANRRRDARGPASMQTAIHAGGEAVGQLAM
jgi:anti-anti-sigma factor